MKKLFLMIAAVAATFSAFAEDFNYKQYNKIFYQQGATAAYKYAYECPLISGNQLVAAIMYRKLTLKQNLTKQQIDQLAIKVKASKYYLSRAYALAQLPDLIDDINCGIYASFYYKNNQIDKYLEVIQKFPNAVLSQFSNLAKLKKYDLLYTQGQKVLLTDGGCDDSKQATKLVQTMFRYKPATVTKEDQIKFIQKLAQIYPIPGTDFSQWKSFMGFIGYKYKALTGKDLF